jgi:hypothetical protein
MLMKSPPPCQLAPSNLSKSEGGQGISNNIIEYDVPGIPSYFGEVHEEELILPILSHSFPFHKRRATLDPVL